MHKDDVPFFIIDIDSIRNEDLTYSSTIHSFLVINDNVKILIHTAVTGLFKKGKAKIYYDISESYIRFRMIEYLEETKESQISID